MLPSVVSQEYWFRVKCYGPSNTGGHPFDVSFALGAQATTRITNVTWNENLASSFIQALKNESSHNGGDLSMRLSFYFYTRTYEPFVKKNFTLAHIVGSIGVAGKGGGTEFWRRKDFISWTFFSPQKDANWNNRFLLWSAIA